MQNQEPQERETRTDSVMSARPGVRQAARQQPRQKSKQELKYEKRREMRMKQTSYRDAIREKSFKEKISYTWTYYKWWFIGTVVIAIVAGSWIKSAATNYDTDLRLLITADTSLSESADQAVDEVFTPYAEDVTGDGRAIFQHMTLGLSSETADMSPELNMAMVTKFMVEMSTEPSYICLLNDYFYNMLTAPGEDGTESAESTLLDLGELLGGDYSGKFALLKDTPLRDWECFKELPDDTKIVFVDHRQEGDGKKAQRTQREYDLALRVFQEIMTEK